MQDKRVTPPSSCTQPPLTPPPSDKKHFTEARRVIAHFRHRYAGRETSGGPLKVFQLVQGEYEHIERTLRQDDELWRFVNAKIRHDYDAHRYRLFIRMHTTIHERLVDQVEDEIKRQLREIQNGSGKTAEFAQKVYSVRSSTIHYDAGTSKSKNEPDMSFKHKDAKFPGVIVEVAYSQHKAHLRRLAENYVLDSNTNIRVVVGLSIEYGHKKSREATLSVWRSEIVTTDDGVEMRVVEEIADKAFRDDEGNDVDHPGLQLRLSEFTHKGRALKELGEEDTFIRISGSKLCEYLNTADSKEQEALTEDVFDVKVKKRKRSETPPEEITADDEVRFAGQEERAAERADDDDIDYEERSSTKSLSD